MSEALIEGHKLNCAVLVRLPSIGARHALAETQDRVKCSIPEKSSALQTWKSPSGSGRIRPQK
jgi:hypothetical protein